MKNIFSLSANNRWIVFDPIGLKGLKGKPVGQKSDFFLTLLASFQKVLSDPGGSGCKCASHWTVTGSFASPGGIERVSKIVMSIGTKLCYRLQKLQIS